MKTKFVPRFVTVEQLAELVNFYHLARVPVGSRKYDRMIQAANWLHDKYPDITHTAAYKDLDTFLATTWF